MLKRVALFAGVGMAVLIVARTLPIDVAVGTLRSWAETRGAIGMVGFGTAYVVLALLFVPGAALTMMAGAVFGVGSGLLVVAVATSVADAAAFLLGRYVARDAVLRLMDRYPRFQIVDRTISRSGWRIVALIRLNPTIPYSASNYLFGVTGVAFLPFLVSSGIFTILGAFAYLYLRYVGAETLGGSCGIYGRTASSRSSCRLAVARILGDGTRQRTQVFSELQSHYLFDDRFGHAPGARTSPAHPACWARSSSACDARNGTDGAPRTTVCLPPPEYVSSPLDL